MDTAAATIEAIRDTPDRSALRIGKAPLLNPLAVDRAMQEPAQRPGIDRALLRFEQAALARGEQRAIDFHVAEQTRVVVRVQRASVAEAQLPVAETDGRLQPGQPGLGIEEDERDLSFSPRGPALRAPAQVYTAVRHCAGLLETELPERVCLAGGAADRVHDLERDLGERNAVC